MSEHSKHMMDMKMPDVKMSKHNNKHNDKAYANGHGGEYDIAKEQYPYGLRLTLENDQIEKLAGLRDVEVGDMVDIHAVAKIMGIHAEDVVKTGKKPETRKTMHVQIQKLGIGDESQREKDFNEA